MHGRIRLNRRSPVKSTFGALGVHFVNVTAIASVALTLRTHTVRSVNRTPTSPVKLTLCTPAGTLAPSPSRR